MSANHRIGELQFELSFVSATLEMTHSDALRELVVERLLPVMEQVFDRCAGGDVVWYIDHLELDLGAVTMTALPDVLAQLLGEALEQALEQATHGAAAAQTALPQSAASADLVRLLAYLADGIVAAPQTQGGAGASAVTLPETLLTRVLQHHGNALLAALHTAPQRMQMLARLARQFPQSQLQALLQALDPLHAATVLSQLADLSALLQQIIGDNALLRAAQQAVWEAVLASRLTPSPVVLAVAPLFELAVAAVAAQRQQTLAQAAVQLQHGLPEGRTDAMLVDAGRALALMAASSTLTVRDVLVTGDASAMPPVATATTTHEPMPESMPEANQALMQEPMQQPESAVVAARNQLTSVFMGGHAGAIYEQWQMLQHSHQPLLRSAIRHYAAYGDIREKIAATFPRSLLRDMLVLLAPQLADFNDQLWDDALLRATLDEGADDGAVRWSHWQRNWWRAAMVYLLQQPEQALEQTPEQKPPVPPSAMTPAPAASHTAPVTLDLDAYVSAVMLGAGAAPAAVQARVAVLQQTFGADRRRMVLVQDGALDPSGLPHPAVVAAVAMPHLVAVSQAEDATASPASAVAPSSQPLLADAGSRMPGMPWQQYSVADLERLIHNRVTESSFVDAIIAHGRSARDVHFYYVQVLQALAQNRIVDLELFAQNVAAAANVTEAPAVAPPSNDNGNGNGNGNGNSALQHLDVLDQRSQTQLVSRLAKALMQGNPAMLYSDWDVLLDKHAPLLRQALQHYGINEATLARIAAAFPESMLYDIMVLLAPATAPVWLLLRESLSLPSLAQDAPAQATSALIATTTALSVVLPPAAFIHWKRQLWQAGLQHLLHVPAALTAETIDAAAAASNEPVPTDGIHGVANAVAVAQLMAALMQDAKLNQEAWQQQFLSTWQRLAQQHLTPPPAMATHSAYSAQSTQSATATATLTPVLRSILALITSLVDAPTAVEVAASTVAYAAAAMAATADSPTTLAQQRQALQQLFARLQVDPAWHDPLLHQVLADTGLSASDWEHIVTAYLQAHNEAAVAQLHTFLQAISTQAAALAMAHRPAYFQAVLQALLQQQPVDLDAIAEASTERVAGAAPTITATTTVVAPALAASAPASLPRMLPTPPDVIVTAPTATAALPVSTPLQQPVYLDFLLDADFVGAPGREPEGLSQWLAAAHAQQAPELLPLWQRWASTPAAVTRLLTLLPPTLWPQLARLSPHSATTVQRWRRYVADVADACAEQHRQLSATQLQGLEWAFLAPYLFGVGPVFEPARFANDFLQFLVHQRGLTVTPALTARLRHQMGIAPLAATPQRAATATTEAVHSRNEGDAMGATTIPAGTEIPVANAGLVLTWPFLTRVWETLALTSEKRFINQDAAQRAALLLQVMVDGKSAAPEYQLTLNKLLCGVPLQVPLPQEISVTEQEQDLVEQMLGAMVAHWSALGKTSIQGLRETFLQRPGRLSQREDGWHLQVQHGPFDMLLERLPWGISTVHYPWMEQPLWVKWP